MSDHNAAQGVYEHFSRLAEDWADRYLVRDSFATRLRVMHSVFLEHVVDGTDVLDFGSGAGVFSALASDRAHRVVSMDNNEAMLRAAAAGDDQLARIVGPLGVAYRPGRVERVVAGTDALSETSEFDVVLAIAVLEYLEDLDDQLRRLVGSLRPGGLLIATYPNARSVLRRAEVPIDRVSAAVGRRLNSARLAGREYSALRPRARRDFGAVLRQAGLTPSSPRKVPLGSRGVRRLVAPNQVWVSVRN